MSSPIEVIVSWDEFLSDVRELSFLVTKNMCARGYEAEGVVGISRGGLIPAAVVANELGLKKVVTVSAESYEPGPNGIDKVREGTKVSQWHPLPNGGKGYVVVDDLVDTGMTFRAVHKMYPAALFACVYAKPAGRNDTDVYVKSFMQNEWVRFPWELKLGYVPPQHEKRVSVNITP